MISRSVAVALLATGCLTAAAGGSYLAVRHNAAEASSIQPAEGVAPEAPAPRTPAEGVSETEAVVPAPGDQPERPEVAADSDTLAPPAAPPALTPKKPQPRRVPQRPVTRPTTQRSAEASAPGAATPAPTSGPVLGNQTTAEPPAVASNPPAALPPAEVVPTREAPATVEPEVSEITVPASAVIGLEIETTVSSEKAQIEDRVEARVTRNVYADGRLAIPAGSRVIGGVAVVEKGGKLKDRARLGVRFHTLVLADGQSVPLRTETILREGDSPGAESSRKIGGAAIGGAVLGAILGGGKGAVTGATVGAAGGTAAVMAGGRNAAVLASGSIVTVRLASPVTLEVGR